jgi:hypothetical protein
MFTHAFMMTLASFLLSTTSGSPAWQTDYESAQKLGKEGAKPLAVFIGPGKTGWNRVSREAELGKDVNRLLAKKYICVHVNTELHSGKRLAAAFEIPNGVGLVVSDHSGKYQAFSHQGDLPRAQLLHYLTRYADSTRIVRATETNQPQAVSYAPAEDYSPPVYYQPYSGLISRGC